MIMMGQWINFIVTPSSSYSASCRARALRLMMPDCNRRCTLRSMRSAQLRTCTKLDAHAIRLIG